MHQRKSSSFLHHKMEQPGIFKKTEVNEKHRQGEEAEKPHAIVKLLPVTTKWPHPCNS